MIQENADPDVRTDLERYFERLVPEDRPRCTSTRSKGPDDMPAHIRSALTQSQLSIPVVDGPAGPGHLAGDLSVRAPRVRRTAAAWCSTSWESDSSG